MHGGAVGGDDAGGMGVEEGEGEKRIVNWVFLYALRGGMSVEEILEDLGLAIGRRQEDLDLTELHERALNYAACEVFGVRNKIRGLRDQVDKGVHWRDWK